MYLIITVSHQQDGTRKRSYWTGEGWSEDVAKIYTEDQPAIIEMNRIDPPRHRPNPNKFTRILEIKE